MPTLFATFRKVKPSNPKSGNGDTFRTMFHRIALCISIPLLIAACVSDTAGEPMFEESGDEQSVLGPVRSPQRPTTPATTRRWQPTSRVHRYRSAPALLDRMLMNLRRRFSTIASSLQICGVLSWLYYPLEWGSTE